MNEKEQLYEQYEDALLALLMNEVAEAEGAEWIEKNKQLRSDPNAAVPEIVTERCKKTIMKQGRKARRRNMAHGFARILGRVAVVALISLLLFVGVLAVSETARVNTLNFVIDHIDVGTIFRFGGNQVTQRLNLEQVWMPEGFALVSSSEGNYISSYIYQNDTGDEISIETYRYADVTGGLVIDTENAEVTYPVIGDTEVMLSYKANEYQAVWPASDGENFIVIVARNVPYEDVLQIAESLIANDGG